MQRTQLIHQITICLHMTSCNLQMGYLTTETWFAFVPMVKACYLLLRMATYLQLPTQIRTTKKRPYCILPKSRWHTNSPSHTRKNKKNGNTIFLIRGDGYVAGKEKVPAKNIIGIITKVEHNGIDINQNKINLKLATAIWSKIQTIRWFFYRIKRKLQTSYTYLANK